MYNIHIGGTMKRINFYLSDREIQYLKKIGKEQGLSASDILRRILDKEIDKYDKNLRELPK